MNRRVALGAALVISLSFMPRPIGAGPGSVRLDAIRRAQVWTPTNVATMDIKSGPSGQGAFAADATVACEYVDKKMSGRSPKFTCVIPPDDEVKVKYGPDNGEVYAEVATTRLLWALGFGADRMYPVRIVCKGCPSGVVGTDVSAIERKLDGQEIESDIESGWAWRELDLVDPDKGGATRAQRDALKLLAVFVQHTDSKTSQQRLLCADARDKSPKDERARCEKPFMIIQDVGLTFGRAMKTNGIGASASLTDWAATPIWKDPARCVGNVRKSWTGTLKDPVISEEGRQFLAGLLKQLTDQQIRDLFNVARFGRRTAASGQPAGVATVEPWVEVFKRKRTEIVDHICPGSPATGL